MTKRWEEFDQFLDRVEQVLLILFLGLMILIAFAQIALRNFLASGLTWGDPLVRNLVLWVSLIGATLATREKKHISIDIVSRWISPQKKNLVEVMINLFAFSICGLLVFAALKFIKNESEMGNIIFLKIPSWIPTLILPITFGLMAFRFGLQTLKNLSHLFQLRRVPPQEKEP